MVTIKNTVRLVSFDFEQGTFKANGEARVNADNTLQQINGTIYTEGGVYAGNFSSLKSEDGNMKLNISGVDATHLAEIAEVVNSGIIGLKEKIGLIGQNSR